MTFRSMLFVPGARPDRFEKAIASGADAVCIDLEDAVAPAAKAEARAAALAFLGGKRDQQTAIGLRLNALNTRAGIDDLAALLTSSIKTAFIMIPKASGAQEVLQLRAVLSDGENSHVPPFWPLMESPEGLTNLNAMAMAVGEEGLIMFGGADYSASLGCDMSWEALYHARASIVAAAALSGCATLDVPWLDVKDDEGLRRETCRVKALGFSGRACIHPAQIATVNAIFTPSVDELSAAERVRAAYEENRGGVVLLDGKLIEKPVLRAADRVLARKRD